MADICGSSGLCICVVHVNLCVFCVYDGRAGCRKRGDDTGPGLSMPSYDVAPLRTAPCRDASNAPLGRPHRDSPGCAGQPRTGLEERGRDRLTGGGRPGGNLPVFVAAQRNSLGLRLVGGRCDDAARGGGRRGGRGKGR